MGETIINPDIKKTFPWKLAVIFLLFSAVIIIMGIYYYRYERNRIFAEQEKSLSAIATLKIGQIQQWHSERLIDAVVIRDNRLFIRSIKQYMYDKNAGLKDELLYWMQSVSRGTDYFNVLLTDTTFKVRLSVLKSDTVAGEVIEHDLRHVLKDQNIIMTDLHRSSHVSNVHMDILVPLSDSVQKKRIPVGVIILRIDPEKTLFPLIQSWPTPSKSSETLLIRKEGDSVIFLNELRHRYNTSLNLRLPLIESLPASMVANGVTGLVEGRDYRNIPVVAWLADVPGFPWYMVAKTDKEEILAPFKRYSVITVFVIILLILINASIFGFWIWQQRIKFYRSQLKYEVSLRESEERFRSLYENVTIGIYRTTIDGRILMANPAMVSMLGFDSFEQLAQRNLQQEGYEPDYPRSKFLEIIEKDGKIIGLESAWHRRNGKALIIRESAHAVRDAKGRILYYDGTVEDITDRKKTEEALYENEKRLREAQEMAHLGFWLWDIKTGNVEWSDEVYKIFCLDPATFKPQIESILELSPWPEENQRDKELIARAMETHTPGDYEQKFLRPDKSVGYYYSTFRGNYNDSGELISIVGTVLDITERKLAEDALRESEDKFKYVFDHSLIPKSITFPSGEINVNRAFCEMLGYQPEELKRINWADISHPDDIELTNNSLNLVLSGKKDSVRFIKRYIHKNGTIVWADVGTSLRRDVDNNPQYFLTSANDITERKAAEDALRDSEERFSKSFRTSPISFMIANMEDGRIIEINDAFTTISGFTRKEAIGSTTLKMKIWFHEKDRKNMIDSLLKGKAILRKETMLRGKEGNVATVLLSAQVIKLANRNCIISSIEDITERKHAEEALRESEERFRSMANSIPQLAWVARADGFIYWYNQRWYEYTGTKPEQMEGWGWQIVHDPTVLPEVMEKWTASIASGQLFEMSFPLRGADGLFRTFLTRVQPWKDAEGRVVQWFGTNTDVETIKRAEEIINRLNEELEQKVMQRTELLEAANKELEAFSYSVSHDLRAPLRSVHGFTKILLEDYEASLDEEGKRICGIISSSATQMGALIDDLLSFSRIGRSRLNPSEIDMKKMAKLIFEGMTSPTERKRIKMNIGRLPKAFGDVTLFGQVWTNLISNAIKYTSKNDLSEINIGSKTEGNLITYFIKDNGVGFDMQYAHKLFGVFQRLHSEAEFEGNGVGLAIIQRIILKHGGKVWAEGKVGKGATFYFSLPATGK